MKISTLRGAPFIYPTSIGLPKKELQKAVLVTAKLLRISTKLLMKYVKLSIKNVFFSRSTFVSFGFAYLYEVLPRLTKRIWYLITQLKFHEIPQHVLSILLGPFDAARFPMFIMRLVATLNTFTPFCKQFLSSFPQLKDSQVSFGGIFLASLLSALLNFPRFQKEKLKVDRFYTLDWSVILLTRALETVILTIEPLGGKHSVFTHGDAVIFIIANYIIMNTWFFEPEKLIPDYRKWLNDASNIDLDIPLGLRYLREGKMDYSKRNTKLSQQDHFMNVCENYMQDREVGDLTKQPKLPCKIFHQFQTTSCLRNAIRQFNYEFRFAFGIYAWLNVFAFVFIRGFRGSIKRLIWNTTRSSLFLATSSLIRWSMICFIRNHHPGIKSQRFWDLFAVKFANLLSGFAIYVESPHRRKELSMFVVPKALETFIDPTVTDFNTKLETGVFSISFAILIAYARSSPSKLRGIVGKALSYTIKN